MSCIVCNSSNEKLIFTYKDVDFFKCKSCNLIRTFPFPTKNQIEDHYKKKFVSGNYEVLRKNIDFYQAIYQKYINLINSENGSLKNKKILDIGCFTGDFLSLVQDKGAIPYGVELQKDAFKIANKKFPNKIQNCFFEKAKFNFKFDIITMFGLIEHLTNPERLLMLVYSWLADDGIIIIQTPNTDSIFAKILKRYWPPYEPIEHIHYFSQKNIRMFLEKYKFNNIEVIPHYKKLSIDYVFCMLGNFGSEFQKIFSPIYKILPKYIRSKKLSFYVGEMICIATKTQNNKSSI